MRLSHTHGMVTMWRKLELTVLLKKKHYGKQIMWWSLSSNI